METTYKRHLITAALPYANGPVHIGHLAGVYVPADIYVRYLRLRGEDVLFICGSDEHGVPITIKARQENVSPQDIVDKFHGMIRMLFPNLAFLSVYIPAPLQKPIIKQLLIFSGNCMIRVTLSKKQPASITMKRPSSSWPTGILPAPARFAAMNRPMAISAKNAVPR